MRLVTPLPEQGGEEEASQRLAASTKVLEPRLYYHIPQESLIAGEERAAAVR